MNITFDINVPESREVTIRLPDEMPTGPQRIEVRSPASDHSANAVSSRVGQNRELFDKWVADLNIQTAEFERQLPELLKLYPEQYVAMHEGRVVASGSDQVSVSKQAREIIGDVQCLLRKVTAVPPKPKQVPSLMFHLRKVR